MMSVIDESGGRFLNDQRRDSNRFRFVLVGLFSDSWGT